MEKGEQVLVPLLLAHECLSHWNSSWRCRILHGCYSGALFKWRCGCVGGCTRLRPLAARSASGRTRGGAVSALAPLPEKLSNRPGAMSSRVAKCEYGASWLVAGGSWAYKLRTTKEKGGSSGGARGGSGGGLPDGLLVEVAGKLPMC